MPITTIRNHNGSVNNEIRLIYLIDKESKLPIYFHYVAINLIDNGTLQYVINTL
jgi:hypothetical protein